MFKLLVCLLLVPSICFGGWWIPVFVGGVDEGGVVCTGGSNPLFFWDMEDISDITNGGGCSAGDVTPSINSDAVLSTTYKTSGANSLSCPTGYDHALFDVSTDDIVSLDEGTVTFDLWLSSVSNGSRQFVIRADSSNFLECYISTDHFIVKFVGGGTAVYVHHSYTGLAADTKYEITVKWERGAATTMSVDVNGTTSTTTTTLPATTSAVALYIGAQSGSTGAEYIDDFTVYDSWQ